jgi:hypothetical protein
MELLKHEEVVRHFNNRHCTVTDDEETVLWETTEDYQAPWGYVERNVLRRMNYLNFQRKYAHVKVCTFEGSKDAPPQYEPATKIWLDSRLRRRYDRIVFKPGEKARPLEYNRWRGFARQAKQGDWSTGQYHIWQVLCGGDEELYAYVIAWMARAIQQPGVPGEVAIVLRGKKGTGKGMFANLFCELFGQHAIAITKRAQLLGKFTGHLASSVVMFVDEFAWAQGDKEAESALKTLITEPMALIEPKGKDIYQIRNCSHLIIASNEEWVVPASIDERRYLVLDVDDMYRCDFSYFGRLAAQMQNEGGLEAMLWDLQHHDISGFNVRDVPKTKALDDQKVLSLEPRLKWWWDKLLEGRLFATDEGWTTVVSRDRLTKEYAEAMKCTEASAGTRLGILLKQRLKVWRRDVEVRGAEDRRAWEIKTLDECRAQWTKETGLAGWV